MATSIAESRVQRDPECAAFNPRSGPATGSARPGLKRTAHLMVRRQDIDFRDVAPGQVEIAITVTNAGSSPSYEDFAMVQSATLGAFVAWRRLTVMAVPALQPGESTVLRTNVSRNARASRNARPAAARSTGDGPGIRWR